MIYINCIIVWSERTLIKSQFFSLSLSLSLSLSEVAHFLLDITWMLSKLLSRSRTLKLFYVFLLFNVLGILWKAEKSDFRVLMLLLFARSFYTHYARGKVLYSPTCVSKTSLLIATRILRTCNHNFWSYSSLYPFL